MSGALTTASVLICPHGGTVTASPANSDVTAAAPVLAAGDSCVIAGCTFNVSGAPHPCVSVQWLVTATRVKRGGAMVLNASSTGLCLAADQTPQGAVMINGTQARLTAL